MKIVLLLPVLLTLVFANQNPVSSTDGSPIVVLTFKWSKTRQIPPKAIAQDTGPAAAMIPQNKNIQRNVRVNDPAGTRDPNLDTLDGRSAAMERAVQESRASQSKPVDAFAYRAKVQNVGTKTIEVVFWEYQFIDATESTPLTRRQFLCGVNIKPNKEKELQAISLLGPSVVSAESLGKSGSPFQEKVVINRIEYGDGSIWQRKDFNFAEKKETYTRAIATPWRPDEMCRSL